MDLMTIIGAGVGFGVVYFILQAGGMTRFLLNPEAFILIFGGTFGSVLISYPWSALKHVPTALKMMLVPPKRPASQELILTFVQLAERMRRGGGPTSLSEVLPHMPHPFMADGVQMLIDGLDQDLMRERFERDILATRHRHLQVSGIFRSAGSYAPIFGLLGTLIGVVSVLRNITNPSAMGASMAVAMTASFYGIFSANFLFLPIASKLNFYSEEEMVNRELIAKGVLALANEEAPWLIARRLEGYLAQYLRRGAAPKTRAAA